MDEPNETQPAEDDDPEDVAEKASPSSSTDDGSPLSTDELAHDEPSEGGEGEETETSEVVAEEVVTEERLDAREEAGTGEAAAADGDATEEAGEESLDDMERRAESEGVSMMELLLREGDYLPERMQRGDLVEGVIVGKERNQLTINIGAKQDGVVPSSDVLRLPPGYFEKINVGDTVQAIVIRPENREGEVLVSIHQALTLTDWDDAQAVMDSGEIIELEIVGFNKGGVLVGFGNLQGFLPRSHLSRLAGKDQGAAERLAEFIGETVPVKVIEVERRKRRLIMSERLALREWRSVQKKKILNELVEGQIRKGRISSIADFGAFVDLGGADGLVHVSEMTYERGKHPRDVVKVGQEVDVYVLHVDHERSRIGLSMKRLIEDPWANVEETHYVGELAEGTISNLADFGAFARLEDGLEGLIHISELSDGHIEHPSEAVRVGQKVTVEVVSIEPDRQRIGLSIRRVPEHLRVGLADQDIEGDSADAGDESTGESTIEAEGSDGALEFSGEAAGEAGVGSESGDALELESGDELQVDVESNAEVKTDPDKIDEDGSDDDDDDDEAEDGSDDDDDDEAEDDDDEDDTDTDEDGGDDDETEDGGDDDDDEADDDDDDGEGEDDEDDTDQGVDLDVELSEEE